MHTVPFKEYVFTIKPPHKTEPLLAGVDASVYNWLLSTNWKARILFSDSDYFWDSVVALIKLNIFVSVKRGWWL